MWNYKTQLKGYKNTVSKKLEKALGKNEKRLLSTTGTLKMSITTKEGTGLTAWPFQALWRYPTEFTVVIVMKLKVSLFPKYWQIIVTYLCHRKSKTKAINLKLCYKNWCLYSVLLCICYLAAWGSYSIHHLMIKIKILWELMPCHRKNSSHV
jgi:hypothetical protein